MKRAFVICSFLIMMTSCMPESQNKTLTYQNIIILSDMSSRVNNQRFPQKDINEIHNIIQYFKNECVKPGEKIGDKSSISFAVFSEKDLSSIDLAKFKKLGDKQSFINSTGKYKNNGLEWKLAEFEESIKSSYNKISNPGLDLLSILIEKIENDNIVKQDEIITNGVDTTFIKYENHIYIFTDGYLEYATRDKLNNNQFYFGSDEIERVRQYCLKNEIDISTALKQEKNLSLPASHSESNKYITLHVLETHERDKDTKFQTYKHPKGFRDNEILAAVWQKWAIDSGFKKIEWQKY